jgi:DNA-binding beta-propeller fold protein YncE
MLISSALSRFAIVAVLIWPLMLRAATPLLTAHVPIEIAGSRGGFEQIQVDGPRRRLLLAHTGNGTLDVLDLRTEKLLAQIKTGAAQAVMTDHARKHYYVSAGPERKLVVVDAEKLTVAGEILLPGTPAALTPGPTGVNRLFVARADAAELWVIDPATKQIVSTLPLPDAAGNLLAEDDNSLLYVNIRTKGTLLLLSASDHNSTVGGAWPVAPAKHANALALDTRSPRRIFVAGFNGQLAMLDTSGKVLGSAPLPTGVEHIALDADWNRLYCASSSGRIAIIDNGRNGVRVAGEVTTPRGAKAIAVDLGTHAVWIAYTAGGKSFTQKFTVQP